jgi:hypothetical protein
LIAATFWPAERSQSALDSMVDRTFKFIDYGGGRVLRPRLPEQKISALVNGTFAHLTFQ